MNARSLPELVRMADQLGESAAAPHAIATNVVVSGTLCNRLSRSRDRRRAGAGLASSAAGYLQPVRTAGLGHSYPSTPRHALKIWRAQSCAGVVRWTVGGSLRAKAKWRGSATFFATRKPSQ